MSILLSSLLVYMLLIAFCVWLIGVCVALAPFVPLDVFTLVPMCLCDRNSLSLFRAPRFKGYQQQDSQELLHYLLDSMRVEETKVSEWFIFFIVIFYLKSNFGPVFIWDRDLIRVIRSQIVRWEHLLDLAVMCILSSLTTFNFKGKVQKIVAFMTIFWFINNKILKSNDKNNYIIIITII